MFAEAVRLVNLRLFPNNFSPEAPILPPLIYGCQVIAKSAKTCRDTQIPTVILPSTEFHILSKR